MIRLPGPGEEVTAGLARLGLLTAGVIAILSYAAIGREYYAGYHIPQGTGMMNLVPEEVTWLAMFSACGLVALAGLAGALQGTPMVERATLAVRRLAERPLPTVAATAVAAALASAAVGAFVLGHAVVTDDEHTYRFIAETLRTGSLTAPSPGSDLPFFREQFVVLTPEIRYGKYPIGHPVLLAIGQALGAEPWVVPLLTGATVILVYLLGARLFGPALALVAVALVASSPQVLTTGATVLSQPASAVCLLVGLAALVAAEERAPDAGTPLLVLAGAALAYGIVVRPLPGVLFTAVAGARVLWQGRRLRPRVRLVRSALAFGLPVALGVAVLLVQNRLQSGGALTSGYHTYHAVGEGAASIAGFLGGDLASRAMSVLSAVLRLDAWAFGWPLGPWLALAALRVPRTGLLWSMIAAALSYRILSPKAGVSPTGPVYLYEIVPLVALLSAVGAARLARAVGRTRVAAILVAGMVVSATMFMPGRLSDLYTMGLAQRTPGLMLERSGIHQAVVFHDGVVPWWTRSSWAYYPRCNSPQLDDDVLYLHSDVQRDLEEARAFWRRRFPGRSAWVFQYVDGRPRLLPLEQAVAEARAGVPPL